MVFSSLTFLFLFLPITILFYFLFKNRKIRNVILLLFSLIFYAWGEPIYIILMILTVLLNYFAAIYIEKNKQLNRQKEAKIIFILALIITVGSLLFFKYTNFLLGSLNDIFSFKINALHITLPIGISFYTFQVLSYLIDVYRGTVKAQEKIINLGTYVALFPQLIAGPIVRYSDIEYQLENRVENLKLSTSGIRRFIIGLAKKVIIANNMAMIADTIFNSANLSIGFPAIFIGLLAYTFQIYYDFSGYSDMAIGLGKIFGFEFLENFNYPYISLSITDFWHRWHISLSTWFRDYIYIPLGGNRISKQRWILNIFIVWLLTGFWHGASWNFIIWGLYYGIILVLEKLFLHRLLDKLPKFIRWIYAFAFIMIGWLIFRIEDLSQLGIAFSQLFSFGNIDPWAYFLENFNIVTYFIYFIPAILFCRPIFANYYKKKEDTFFIDLILISLLLVCIFFIVSGTYNPFIYFRF